MMSAFASVGRKEPRKLLTGNSSVENAGRTSHSHLRLRSQKEEGVEGEAGFPAAPMGRGQPVLMTQNHRSQKRKEGCPNAKMTPHRCALMERLPRRGRPVRTAAS